MNTKLIIEDINSKTVNNLKEIYGLKKEIKVLDEKLIESKFQNEQLKTRNSNLNSELEIANKTINELNNRIKYLEKTKTDNELDIASLKDNIKEKEGEISELKSKLSAYEKEIKDKKEKFTALEKELKSCNKDLIGMKKENENLSGKLEKADKKINQLIEENEVLIELNKNKNK